MRKIGIYNKPKEGEVLWVDLVYNSLGVDLVIVDKEGRRLPKGSVLPINNNGTTHRYSGLSVLHRLRLDKHGRIRKEHAL